MGKVVKTIVGVALIGAALFAGPLGIAGALSGGLFGAGIVTQGFLLAVGSTLLLGSFLTPKIPKSQLSRLNVTMDVGAPRKMAFGTTAFPLDLRYHEGKGDNQEEIHYIVAHTAHEVASIDSIYFEQDLAWTSGGGVQGEFVGYLEVTTRTEGAAGNEVTISSNWGSGERLTGCSYTYFKIKRDGIDDDDTSPLQGGLPSRITVIGEGALLYDPRLDSTVPGGSGAHRADDQTTWGASYSPADSYDNPALQLLWFLLGWKIGGKLSVGCGIPKERIDLESFITAANACDEDVSLDGGGTQDRYRTSGTASDGDARMDIINVFLTCMNASLRDNSGKLSLTVMQNDLANYVLDFDDNDLLEGFEWNQTASLAETYNIVRGRYVDPSTNSLYQLVDYPEIEITSPDGIERVLSLDLPFVEEGRRAQRLAKQRLQRNQYQGTFRGVFNAKALGCDVGEVVRLSLEPLGWSNKLFRVIEKDIRGDGTVPLALLEEDASIYAWDAEESAVVTATAPVSYDPLNSPLIVSSNALRSDISDKNKVWVDTEEPLPIIAQVGDPDLDPLTLTINFGVLFGDNDVWFNPESNLGSTWDGETAVWTDSVVDITKSITGVSNLVLNYDSGGTLTTTTPLRSIYTISPAGGSALTTGVTWAATTKLGAGQVDSDIWSGTSPSISGSGSGQLAINSGLKIAQATVNLTATVGGVTYPAFAVTVDKVTAEAGPEPGGDYDSVNLGGVSINSSTYATVASLTVTTKSGSTDVDLTANGISITPANNELYASSNIKFKWQWDSDGLGTWTDVGSEADSSPDPFSYLEEPGLYDPVPGSITCDRNKASLTASTEYDFRLQARISSGSTTKTFDLGGTVSAQG